MRRLTVTLLLVVLVAIFGLGIALDYLFERYHVDAEDEYTSIQSLASGFASVIDHSKNPQAALHQWPDDLRFLATIETIDDLSLPAQLTSAFVNGKPLLLESDVGVSLHYFLPSHQKVLSIHNTSFDSTSWPIAIVFTSAFYLGTLFLLILWLKPLLSRLQLLRKTTRAFGTGELASRVPCSGLSFIRDIESDFNSMADRIQQLVDDNKLLTSAVSHDLRTPLARLRFGIETLEENTDSEARLQYHKRINRDLTKMENLVNALLRYARLDSVLEDVDRQPVSLRNLIHECAAQFYDNRILIKIDDSCLTDQDTLTISGSIEHLATVFNNLIQNATVYANSKLIICLLRKDSNIEIAFCDDGPGIPVQQRSTLLKPFQRGSDTNGGGYGLGLAVVERIARHHHATVSIGDSLELGGGQINLVFTTEKNQA